jgi:hypothetical protein
MPEPPHGEANLRALARRFEEAEQRIRGLAGAAVNGDRRNLLLAALAILIALRQEDFRRPVITAYIAAFTAVGNGGDLRPPRDLAGSLAHKLDRGAQRASQAVRATFPRVREDNLEEMSDMAVLAHVDERGTSWSLGRWAEMNTSTIGRGATSRGLADALGEGGGFRVEVGECQRCRELFAGTLVVGQDPLPPGHPSCTCVAKPIRSAVAA